MFNSAKLNMFDDDHQQLFSHSKLKIFPSLKLNMLQVNHQSQSTHERRNSGKMMNSSMMISFRNTRKYSVRNTGRHVPECTFALTRVHHHSTWFDHGKNIKIWSSQSRSFGGKFLEVCQQFASSFPRQFLTINSKITEKITDKSFEITPENSLKN